MLPSQWALVGFVLWTLLIVLLGIGVPRVGSVLRKEARPNSFVASVPHGTERYQRTLRAHLNCVENLPVFAAVVLAAYAIGQRQVADSVAMWVLLARVAQSTTHLIGVNHMLVMIRATFFTIQSVLIVYMIGKLLL